MLGPASARMMRRHGCVTGKSNKRSTREGLVVRSMLYDEEPSHGRRLTGVTCHAHIKNQIPWLSSMSSQFS